MIFNSKPIQNLSNTYQQIKPPKPNTPPSQTKLCQGLGHIIYFPLRGRPFLPFGVPNIVVVGLTSAAPPRTAVWQLKRTKSSNRSNNTSNGTSKIPSPSTNMFLFVWPNKRSDSKVCVTLFLCSLCDLAGGRYAAPDITKNWSGLLVWSADFGLLFFGCVFQISLSNFVLVHWCPDVVSMSDVFYNPRWLCAKML